MYTAKRRLLLTGTPLQNSLPELWALLNFLLPSIFSSVDTFEGCDLGVPSCGGAFTPSSCIVSGRGARGWSLFGRYRSAQAHRIKNERAQLSKTVRLLKTENRLLVTGTPLQNNLHELWGLLNFLLPDVFASAERFDELFNLQSSDRDKTHKLVEQLHRLLRPFMIRRLKADVEKDLPRKTETILFTSLAPIQRDVYKQCLLREISTVQGSAAQKARGPLLNLVMQLRKCCNHPYLFPHVEDRSLPALGEHLVDACGKLKVLDKLLARLKERNHRVLVFSQMTRMLDVLEDFLVMRFGCGVC